MSSMLVKDVFRTKSCNHAKVAKDSKVKETSCRQASSKEHHYTFRGCLVKSLEALKVNIVVVVNGKNYKS